ncbi:MAG: hypothetical protein M3R38_13435 [Actinomycetota bacterium]|nr:hypothetical protein [Actinomycetota bacterium]
MTKRSVAPPARAATPETTPGYVLRGLGLFELHADEILHSYRGAGRYVVPSGTEANGLFEVRVGTRPERNRCECRGFTSYKHCSHVVAASRVAKRSAVCDSCGERRWDRELVEVTEDDDSLTWFVGDRLCKACVLDHGGIA